MNAAFLLMSSTLVAGADTPPPAPAPAPAVAQPAPTWPSPAYGVPAAAGGCSSCAPGFAPGCSDPCPCEKTGLFARLRNRGGCDCGAPESKKKHGIFHGFTTSASCDSCDGGRGGLFSRLHSHLGRGQGDCGCDGGWAGPASWGGPFVGGCALPPAAAPAAPAAPTEAPKPMEKPKEPAKTTGSGSARLPAPSPVTPSIPVLAGAKSPF